jgi:hypothetical protein
VRRLEAPLGQRLAGVLEELERHGAAKGQQPVLGRVDLVDDVVGEVGVGVADERVAALDEPFEVLVGQAQQPAQHAHGQLARDGAHEVELRLAAQVVEHLRGEVPYGILVAVDGLGREGAAHEAAQAGVLGRVHLHHGAPGFCLLGVHVLEADAEAAREDLGVGAGEEYVVVLRQAPEAPSAVALLGPVHGIVRTQPGEGVVRHARDVGVVRREIGQGRIHRTPLRTAIVRYQTSGRIQHTEVRALSIAV